MDPKGHILNIRRNYIGENTAINSDGEMVVGNLIERLSEAIKELAKNIYKKDSHFIMELIQNADDNEYKKGVIPTLKIIQNEKRIIFQNNENGFSKENIDSICSIGESTKSKKRIKEGEKGYIGEKGIGFKSVFRVCDEPEIYSNGFQFKFKSKSTSKKKKELAYILPQWIDIPSERIKNSYTNILLPFKNSLTDIEKKKLTDVKPDLLLFLNKLEKLDINDEVSNIRNVVSKSIDGNVVSLKRTEYINGNISGHFKKDYFLIERNKIKVPDYIKIEQRKGITRTRIILAFPLDNKSKLKAEGAMQAYAYLPIGNSGFPFMIQADFILTSGRESIDEDNPWNDWIRKEIAETFKYAINELKKHDQHKYTFLQFVPTSVSSIPIFFQPIATEIISYCQDSKVVLSETNNKWCMPSDVITASDKQRKLFNNELLKSSTGKEYINSLFSCDETVCRTLNIRSFKDDIMYNCLDNFSLIRKKDIKWFFDLFLYLSLRPDSQKIAKRVSEIQIIPIESTVKSYQNLVMPKGCFVFYPLDRKISYSFENSINLLSNQLFTKINSFKNTIHRKRILDFLDELKIQVPEPYQIIQNFIIKKYETDEWKYCSAAERKDHMEFIIKHWLEIKKHHNRLIDCFTDKYILRCIDIGDGKIHHSIPSNVYISSCYGNTYSLEKLFSGINDIWFIHDCYQQISPIKNRKKKTRKKKSNEAYAFFKALGCKEIPDIPFKNTNLDLSKVIGSKNPTKINQLFSIVDAHWKEYKNYTHATKTLKRAWFKSLSEDKVIPVGKNLYYAKDIYIKDDQIKSFFGSTVTYFPRKITLEFAKALGFITSINSQSIVAHLKDLSSRNVILPKEKAFKLYKHLWKDDNPNLSEFKNYPLIYLPETERWYKSMDLMWADYKDLLGNSYGYCEKSYPASYKDFFVNELNVIEKPDVNIFISALKIFDKKEDITDSDKQKIHKIFAELGSYTFDPEVDEKAFEGLNELIWTNKGEFWINEGDVFYNDDSNLVELYKDEDSIAFLDIPKEYLPRINRLLDILAIPPISKVVEKELAGIDYAIIDKKLTNKLRKYTDTIVSWIHSVHYWEFEQHRSYYLDKLLNIEIFESPELVITYNLNGKYRTSNALSFHDNNRIYINRDNPNKILSAAFELAGLLELPQIIEFILILFKSPKDFIDTYLSLKNIISPPDDLSIGQIEQEEFERPEEEGEDESFKNTFTNDNEDASHPYDPVVLGMKTTNTINKITTNGLGTIQLNETWQPEISVSETSVGIEQYFGSYAYLEDVEIEGRTFNKNGFGSSTSGNVYSSQMSQADKDAIGYFGEEKVYFELKNELKKKYPNHKTEEEKNSIFRILKDDFKIAELKWLNYEYTLQEGYDLTLEENGAKKYIEVKTTIGNESVTFSLSYQQWKFVKLKADNYSIIRVLYAGTERVKLKEIKNPYLMFVEGKLKAYPIYIELT